MWLWVLYNQYGAMVGLFKDLIEAERVGKLLTNSDIKGNFFALSDFLFNNSNERKDKEEV